MSRIDLTRIDGLIGRIAWPYAVIYTGMWLMALATVRGADFLSVDPNCQTLSTWITPLWYCSDGALMGTVADLANASILLTLWVPAFIMSGVVDPYSATIALPILLVHAIGIPATIYAAVRTSVMLMENVVSPLCRGAWRWLIRSMSLSREQVP